MAGIIKFHSIIILKYVCTYIQTMSIFTDNYIYIYQPVRPLRATIELIGEQGLKYLVPNCSHRSP